MKIKLGDEYFIGNCLHKIVYMDNEYCILEDMAGIQLPLMNYKYLSHCIKATEKEKAKRLRDYKI